MIKNVNTSSIIKSKDIEMRTPKLEAVLCSIAFKGLTQNLHKRLIKGILFILIKYRRHHK